MPRYSMNDGEQLYVREVGRGEPVLLLSGLGMQSWQWLPYLVPHLKKYKFIIPDWRGFGGSKHCKIPAQDAITSHWQDIHVLIEKLNLNDFILMSYSMGATTAMHGMQYGFLGPKLKAYLHIDQTPKISNDDTWEYGLLGIKHPQLKHLLKELSMFFHQHQSVKKVDDLTLEDKAYLINLWIQFIELQATDKITPKLFKFAFNQPQLQKHILPIQHLDYLRWYIDSYLNHQEDYRDTIAQLDSPVTFFIGQQSTLYPAEGQLKISSSVKNAKNVIFKKSGHTPLITEPLKFTLEISNFLKNCA